MSDEQIRQEIEIEPIPLERALDEAYRLGIREVAEWVENNNFSWFGESTMIRMFKDSWQAKLKEWGIDET